MALFHNPILVGKIKILPKALNPSRVFTRISSNLARKYWTKIEMAGSDKRNRYNTTEGITGTKSIIVEAQE